MATEIPITTICCSGLPQDMTEREFRGLFTFCNGCQNVSIHYKNSHAVGFALFATEAEAQSAIQKLHNYAFEEGARPLSCSMAKTQMDGRKRNVATKKRLNYQELMMQQFPYINYNLAAMPPTGGQKNTLYITGLPASIAEADLIAVASGLAGYSNAKLISKAGKPSLAFVKFTTPQAANEALRHLNGRTMNDSENNSSILSVAFARKEYTP